MKKKFIDLSGKTDPLLLEFFQEISKVSEALSINFFVVGATARDIILEVAYGIPTIRATKDVDLGVQVPTWEEFSKLKETLINTGNFISTKEIQRLKYKDRLPVDVIPFGKIAHPKDVLTWPPKHEVEMNVLGFNEAYEHAALVRLNSSPPLELNFTSLAGLAILKIIAWDNNHPLRKSDARDLILIIRNYLSADNENRLYDEDSDIMEKDFDYECAGARLLGRDMAGICYPKTLETILKILETEISNQHPYRLVEDMTDFTHPQNDFEEILTLLEYLKTGMLERRR